MIIEFIMNYWDLLLVGVVFIGFGVYLYFNIDSAKVWLLQAVIEAEKQFNTGAGQAKFSIVYDLLVSKYPVLKYIPVTFVSKMVDSALDVMREMLEIDAELKAYVEGTTTKTTEATTTKTTDKGTTTATVKTEVTTKENMITEV
jgi:predicted nucleotidyltransferase